MKRVLVLCTGNSCRSQMAEGYLRHFAGQKAQIFSAGIETHGVNKNAIASMQRDGIDISHHTSNNIDEYKDINFDFVITVCDNAKEHCPFFPGGAARLHYNFPDPSGSTLTGLQLMHEFDTVRNKIEIYCEKFVTENLE